MVLLCKTGESFLKKCKYSSEEYEETIDIIISQCEMWTDNNWESYCLRISPEKFFFYI